MRATAVISTYSCRINIYNISSGDKLVYFAANERFDSKFRVLFSADKNIMKI